MTLKQIADVKRAITGRRDYADRISLGLAVRLLALRHPCREDLIVLQEIDHLDGHGVRTQTKPDRQFDHPPLHPFWHKHFAAPRHVLRNIGEHWGLERNGKPLMAPLNDIARKHGHDPDRWPEAVGRLFHEGYLQRFARGLTGDWIIFAKHHGKNYYLDLATHAEGKKPETLYAKLHAGSAAEFSFLFEKPGVGPIPSGL